VLILINNIQQKEWTWHKTWAWIAQKVQLTRYGLEGPVIESPWWARFSAPVQNDPAAHPASCTTGIGSCPEVQQPGCGVDHLPVSSDEVKERVELHLYSSFGLSRPLVGWPLPLLWHKTRVQTQNAVFIVINVYRIRSSKYVAFIMVINVNVCGYALVTVKMLTVYICCKWNIKRYSFPVHIYKPILYIKLTLSTFRPSVINSSSVTFRYAPFSSCHMHRDVSFMFLTADCHSICTNFVQFAATQYLQSAVKSFKRTSSIKNTYKHREKFLHRRNISYMLRR
jgi:hypothetical protein